MDNDERRSTHLQPSSPTPAPVAAPPMTAASPGRVLVVDDDPAIRDMLTCTLSDAGYHVDCAEDGEAGWQALCTDSFELLITDHLMPGLSGLDLLRRVRAGPLQLPVLFISGQMPADEPDLFRWLPPGVALEKPFSLAALLIAVRDLLAFVPRHDGGGDGQSLLAFDTPNLTPRSSARRVND